MMMMMLEEGGLDGPLAPFMTPFITFGSARGAEYEFTVEGASQRPPGPVFFRPFVCLQPTELPSLWVILPSTYPEHVASGVSPPV